MIDLNLEGLKRALFKSDATDWKSKQAWERRAMLWKMTAMALEANNQDENIKKHFKLVMNADQHRAPNEKELGEVGSWLQRFISTHREESKIVIAKG